ncbi:MAG: DUF1059 domain-containing protein [Egibacteraceae bacterium]
MKHFACGDVVPGCAATFSAPTQQGILEQVAGHARRDHGLTEVGDELVSKVVAATTEPARHAWSQPLSAARKRSTRMMPR